MGQASCNSNIVYSLHKVFKVFPYGRSGMQESAGQFISLFVCHSSSFLPHYCMVAFVYEMICCATLYTEYLIMSAQKLYFDVTA